MALRLDWSALVNHYLARSNALASGRLNLRWAAWGRGERATGRSRRVGRSRRSTAGCSTRPALVVAGQACCSNGDKTLHREGKSRLAYVANLQSGLALAELWLPAELLRAAI
jgi:hypothetical protein